METATYPKFQSAVSAERDTRQRDEAASSHSDVSHTTTGGTNGIPGIAGLKGLPNEDTAIWIMELRRRMNMTQRRLAEEIGVSDGLVGQWERGVGRPSKLITETVLKQYGHEHGMVDPPEGGDGFTKVGPRFAAGLITRYAELFGDR